MSTPPGHLEHQRWEGSAAAYVLNALDPQELALFEQHLATCPTCRETVASFQLVADALPGAAPAATPPPELRDRIMATVRSEAELLRAAGPQADRPPAPAPAAAPGDPAPAGPTTAARAPAPRVRRRAWRGLTLRPATALAALALLGAGVAIGAVTLGNPTVPQVAVRTAFVNPRIAPGARASVRRSTTTATALQVTGLPAPSRGRIWQVWVARPGQPPQPNVRFALTTGTVVIAGDLRGVSQVMVTEEPIAFVPPAPTGPLVLRANLA